MLTAIGLITPPRSVAQPVPTKTKFKATSVKPCGDASTDRKTGEVFPGVRGGRGGGSSPGRLRLGCWTVKELVLSAYVRYANGQDRSILPAGSMPIEGGPAWINYDRYTIEANPRVLQARKTGAHDAVVSRRQVPTEDPPRNQRGPGL